MKAHVPAPARRVLIQFVVLALAAGDAVGSLLAEEPPRYAVPLAVIAVGVLPFRNKMPYLALALTLPGLIFDVTLAPADCAVHRCRTPEFAVCPRAVHRRVLRLLRQSVGPRLLRREHDTELGLCHRLQRCPGVVGGLLIRARAALSDKLAEIERARAHEEELLVQQAITQERTALAREMHDVISHKVSLIAVQAGALQVTSSDPASAETARTIRALSVRTLDELREMVGVLRPSATHEIELAPPQPSIDDLPPPDRDIGYRHHHQHRRYRVDSAVIERSARAVPDRARGPHQYRQTRTGSAGHHGSVDHRRFGRAQADELRVHPPARTPAQLPPRAAGTS